MSINFTYILIAAKHRLLKTLCDKSFINLFKRKIIMLTFAMICFPLTKEQKPK